MSDILAIIETIPNQLFRARLRASVTSWCYAAPECQGSYVFEIACIMNEAPEGIEEQLDAVADILGIKKPSD